MSDLEAARRAAHRAASAAGVVVVEVEGTDARRGTAAVERVFDAIWDTGGASVMPDEILRMYALTGQYLTLACEPAQAEGEAGAGEVIAASLALFAAPAGTALHSHITGVLPAGLGRAVGYALKLHQRVWALERGIEVVSWTFDPLIRRNAWFNLGKLAARPVRYLVDFYGAMPDAINAGDATDRLYLHWRLASAEVCAAVDRPDGPPPEVLEAAALRRNGFVDLIELASDGSPTPVRHGGESAPGVLVAIPADIEALRRTDLDAALRWRHVVRQALTTSLVAGMQISGITRDGHYVLVRAQEER